jgi:putative phosphoesterase
MKYCAKEIHVTYLILSDSHGRPDLVKEAVKRTRPDGIVFCGDGLRDFTYGELSAVIQGFPLWAVRGNCDWLSSPLIIGGSVYEPENELLFRPENIPMLVTHGHLYGAKSGLGGLISHAATLGAQAVIFGHTHTPLELRVTPDSSYGLAAPYPMTLFNPGSLGDRGSFGTLTVRGGQFLFGHGSL